MAKFLLLFFLVPTIAFSMCDFPHNPSGYCLKFELGGKPKKINKYKPYVCEYDLKSATYYRPPKTYHFDSNLNKQHHKKYSKVNFKGSQRITEPKKLLTKECNLKEKGSVVVHLSCYDTYENIPDFRVLSHGKTKDEVYDPWVQKNVSFDCQESNLK
jgi:hypothetical protein